MNKLKLWRIERGLSQVELAIASGVPRYFIQLVEQGVHVMPHPQLEKLASVLGLRPEQLSFRVPEGCDTKGGSQ